MKENKPYFTSEQTKRISAAAKVIGETGRTRKIDVYLIAQALEEAGLLKGEE